MSKATKRFALVHLGQCLARSAVQYNLTACHVCFGKHSSEPESRGLRASRSGFKRAPCSVSALYLWFTAGLIKGHAAGREVLTAGVTGIGIPSSQDILEPPHTPPARRGCLRDASAHAPVGVVEDAGVGGLQVDAQPAGASVQNVDEQRAVRLLKLADVDHALHPVGRPVQPRVPARTALCS